jgi:hypothetical protein
VWLEDVERPAANVELCLSEEAGWEGVEWMHLAQDRDQWRGVVNTVMNLRIP